MVVKFPRKCWKLSCIASRRSLSIQTCLSATKPAMMPPFTISVMAPRSSAPPISLCRLSITRSTLAASPPPTPSAIFSLWAGNRLWRLPSSAGRSTPWRRKSLAKWWRAGALPASRRGSRWRAATPLTPRSRSSVWRSPAWCPPSASRKTAPPRRVANCILLNRWGSAY
ncbi:Uncharacterised protein [Klebsiella pneumoniae]|nr:Uncharacterised protein [Klebsiella pneumoniae]